MDKKDIYEHLAKIYLDASSKKKNNYKKQLIFKNLFFISIVFVLGLGVFLFAALAKHKAPASELALVLCPEPVKINFHFDPVKKEIYSVALNNLDLSKYKTLAFAVKKVNYRNNISLRIEFNSLFKEKSEIYIRDIPDKWFDYKINFWDFKSISDWSSMSNVSFVVEEWNVVDKKGIVYIDNIRFLR